MADPTFFAHYRWMARLIQRIAYPVAIIVTAVAATMGTRHESEMAVAVVLGAALGLFCGMAADVALAGVIALLDIAENMGKQTAIMETRTPKVVAAQPRN